MYLVGKDADGASAVGRDSLENGPNGAGNGNGARTNGNGNGYGPADLDEVRADAARRAATELAAAALNASDGDTASHSDDVDVLADGICRQFGIDGQERENIIAAARLHDIGKVAIPPQILDKPGPLSDAEWAVMRRHTLVGQQILDAVPEMEDVARLVRHSHERWDGEGYPDGIADEEIPLGSRIVACADAYHAVRSDRAYRRGRDAEAALEEIMGCAGTQFDPEVTDALAHLVKETRKEAATSNGARTSYRSNKLAALLLALALGVGASAIAQFAGSPLAPQASADGEPSSPPVAGSPFQLPDLSDLPIFDLAAIGKDDSTETADPAARADGDEVSGARARDRGQTPGDPRPGEADVARAPDAPGAGHPAGGSGGGMNSTQGNGAGNRGTTGTPPAPPAHGNAGGDGNGGGNGGSTTEPPTETPPGQVPGGNPGHGGLPPGNPLAPGHQPEGTPGHGATPAPGAGGSPPGQVMQSQRETAPTPGGLGAGKPD